MPSKSVPFSVRLPAKDADFIASLEIPGAVTPSDKIRQIISDARLRNQVGQDFNEVLKAVQEDLRPSVDNLRNLEREADMQSELMHYFADWLCETLAEFMCSPEKTDDLVKYEARLAQRTVKLTEYILRLAITEDAPCFNPGLMTNTTKRIVELAHVIEARNKEEKANV
ncbi:hypothetical protein [Thalassospira sp. TSL5-1]|uniref:hypothetical protein n=1 Tax=Thalassospira sp. TSL5-1 TaxID=1544451 RepID=UPI0009602C5B|nr:hypothetical protein [Thalassospira sp. TSL5-1]OKH89760.1 hypothetical protein LF95_07575 [Thalassospira sp. TSL5-1]